MHLKKSFVESSFPERPCPRSRFLSFYRKSKKRLRSQSERSIDNFHSIAYSSEFNMLQMVQAPRTVTVDVIVRMKLRSYVAAVTVVVADAPAGAIVAGVPVLATDEPRSRLLSGTGIP